MPPAIPGALEGVLPAAQISIGGRLAAAPGAQSAAAARLQSATGAALQERCAEDHRPPLRRMRGALVLGAPAARDRKSTRLNSSHTVISTLSLHDALPIYTWSA